MDVEIIVPIAFFASIVLIFLGGFRYSANKREAALKTVRTVVEKTGDCSPELIEAIGADVIRKNEDLRKGMLLLAIAAAIIGMGVLTSRHFPEEALGVALFPGLVGMVYVVFHFMNEKPATS